MTVIVSTTSAGLCPLGKVFVPCHVPLLNVAGGTGVGLEGGVTITITGVGLGVGVGVGAGVGVGVGIGVGVATRVWVGCALVINAKIDIHEVIMKTANNETEIIRR